MRRIKRFIGLPTVRKILLFEAFFLSGWYRFLLLHIPFEKISRNLGTWGFETPRVDVSDYLSELQLIRWAVRVACSHTPWESMCLVQALTAKRLLNKRHLHCTLYMGVRPSSESDSMEAHAWLRCGGYIITGENGFQAYTITGIFGDADA